MIIEFIYIETNGWQLHCIVFVDYESRLKVKSIVGSVTDINTVRKACKGVNCVFHLASLVDVRLFPDIKTLYEVNVKGMIKYKPM